MTSQFARRALLLTLVGVCLALAALPPEPMVADLAKATTSDLP